MKKLTALLILTTLSLNAQLTTQDVRDRLELIHTGKSERVRRELPSLLQQYPNDAGVKYLDAYVTANGDQAVKKYQAIVNQFPESEWADDALYKVYQYYYAIGLYKTADATMAQLNQQYPNSIYAKREGQKEEPLTMSQPPLKESETEKPAAAVAPEKETVSSQSVGKYAVQVGVFSQEQTAQKEAMRFTSVTGRNASVFPKQSGGKTVFAVMFEGFESEQSARSFGVELKTKYNIDWFLVKR
ncbi:MAG: SPOR domain-containing protein [Bacteroidota bacterium]